MSRVKAKEIRNLSADELTQKEAKLSQELHDLRQKQITGQLDKPHAFKIVRRQIAQIKTVKREKQNGR